MSWSSVSSTKFSHKQKTKQDTMTSPELLLREHQADDVGQGNNRLGSKVLVDKEDPVRLGRGKLANHVVDGVLHLAGENVGSGGLGDVQAADFVQELEDGLIKLLVILEVELDIGAAGVADEVVVPVDNSHSRPASIVQFLEGMKRAF